VKRVYAITVIGKAHKWLFLVEEDPRYLQEWLDDGLDISLVVNIIPEWVVNLGLTKVWCFLQDIFQFR
jgi:hypothetical protein